MCSCQSWPVKNWPAVVSVSHIWQLWECSLRTEVDVCRSMDPRTSYKASMLRFMLHALCIMPQCLEVFVACDANCNSRIQESTYVVSSSLYFDLTLLCQ